MQIIKSYVRQMVYDNALPIKLKEVIYVECVIQLFSNSQLKYKIEIMNC